MNPFIELINKKKISSAQDLKKIFWQLARECHPDTGKLGNGEEVFKKLKADYDAAHILLLLQLKQTETSPEKSSPAENRKRSHYAALFCEIVSSNFPVEKSVRDTNKAYKKKIDLFAASFALQRDGFNELFSACEEELYKIRGDNIVMNRLFGDIKLILYNICSYYYLKSSFTKKAVEKWLDGIEPQLDKNFPNTKQFLEYLVRDMENVSLSG